MGFSWAPLQSAARVAGRGLALMFPTRPAGDMLALNAVRGDYWVAIHNVDLQYAVDLGLPGLVLFLLLLFGCIRRLGGLRRRDGGGVTQEKRSRTSPKACRPVSTRLPSGLSFIQRPITFTSTTSPGWRWRAGA
jgi:hypothetical protein